ncbi:MAG: Dabb family protein [Opitutales bacterium]|jgi:hypothetical protein
MVTHIVFWKMKSEAEGADAATNMAKMSEMLLALKGAVPGLVELTCGRDFNRSAFACDFAMYSVLESREALAVYQDHPEHVKARNFIGRVTESRAVVDF